MNCDGLMYVRSFMKHCGPMRRFCRRKLANIWTQLPTEQLKPGEHLDAITDRAIEARRVRAAIERLPKEQKKALALAFFKGLTHSEIADLLGEPLGTVKTRIRLAMQKLRKDLLD